MDASSGATIPPVVGIFLAEFHPTLGPRVACQVPEGFVRSTVSTAGGLLSALMVSGSSSFAASASVSLSAINPRAGLGLGLQNSPDPPSGRSTPTVRPTSPLASDYQEWDEFASNLGAETTMGPALGRYPSVTSNVGSISNTNADDMETPQLLHLDFDSVTEYLIPKAEMCNKLLSVSVKRWKLIGHPVMMEDSKYPRNALIFNCCFVFERNADTSCYENIVRRVARVFRFVETESEFISRPRPEISVQNIFEELIEDLNKYHECRIPIDDVNSLNLKVFPKHPEPPLVHDHDVPILLIDLSTHSNAHWDLMILHLIPCINGVDHIKKIAAKADADLNLVKLAVQHLLYYRCAMLIDIFQFSNVYESLRGVKQLLKDHDLRQQCIDFISAPSLDESPRLSLSQVFMLYTAFRDGTSVTDWMSENELIEVPVDLRKFVVFGVVKGFLRRVHRYPILKVNISPASLLPPVDSGVRGQSLLGIGVAKTGVEFAVVPDGLEELKELADGTNSFDAICAKLEVSAARLEKMLELFGEGEVEIEWR